MKKIKIISFKACFNHWSGMSPRNEKIFSTDESLTPEQINTIKEKLSIKYAHQQDFTHIIDDKHEIVLQTIDDIDLTENKPAKYLFVQCLITVTKEDYDDCDGCNDNDEVIIKKIIPLYDKPESFELRCFPFNLDASSPYFDCQLGFILDNKVETKQEFNKRIYDKINTDYMLPTFNRKLLIEG